MESQQGGERGEKGREAKTRNVILYSDGDANVEGQKDQHEQGVEQETQPEIKERPPLCEGNT